MFFSASVAEAALPPPNTPLGTTGPCIKASFRGDASTYNPNFPGWQTGGQSLATGGRYNPNEYAAALQLGLAERYGCGYGRGAICHAVVQAPNGRAMIVRINDNGPLVGRRVIDLNEKSMRYLSGGSMGQNSGVLRDVTVTLLCGIEGTMLGPLDPSERAAWASRTFDAPYANVGGYGASPFGASSPFNAGANAGYPSGGSAYPSAAAPIQSPSMGSQPAFGNAYEDTNPLASNAAGAQQYPAVAIGIATSGVSITSSPAVSGVGKVANTQNVTTSKTVNAVVLAPGSTESQRRAGTRAATSSASVATSYGQTFTSPDLANSPGADFSYGNPWLSAMLERLRVIFENLFFPYRHF